MRKIKVLQIGGNTQKNGITGFLLSVFKLIYNDFSFIFINTAFRISDTDVEKTIFEYGGKIYHLPYKKNVSDIRDKLKEIIDLEKPDVIHCHYFFSNGDFMKFAYEADIPVRIAHCHNNKSGFLNDEEKQILLHSRELTLKYATDKLADSCNAGNFFYGDNHFNLCFPITEVDKFYPITDKSALLKKHELDVKFHYSLFIGRFAFQKNTDFLIDIIKELPDRKLILVGDGPEKEKFLDRIIVEEVSDRCIFKTDENLNELYNISDSLLLPSFYEGFGLVLIEAQYAGTQCFASDSICDSSNLGMVKYLPLDRDIWVHHLKNINHNDKPIRIDNAKFDCKVIVNQIKNCYTANNNLSEKYINIAREYKLGSVNRYSNVKKVVHNFKQAHELGDARGTFYYALQFFEGTGVDKDIKYAQSIVINVIEEIERYVKDENTDFILIMADMYSFGLGKLLSYENALEYYLKAAEHGNLEAMCNLGYMYSVGQGTEKNLKKSFYWYLQSAEGGFLHSMRDVGQCYYFGLGTDINYEEALTWFKKASALNYSHAACDLALCYLKGYGTEIDLEKAAQSYLHAVQQDRSRAIRDLIAHSIDVDEILNNGKIIFINRKTIDFVDNNVFFDGTIVINANIEIVNPAVFYDYPNIKKFFVEKENPYFKAYGSVLYSKDGQTLIRFPLGSLVSEFNIPEHVKHIGEHAFQNCRNLLKIYFHEGIETIGKSAFDDCKNLIEVDLPHSLYKVDAWAFHGCDKIKTLFIPAAVSEIGCYAFGSCEKLWNISVDLNNKMYISIDGNLYSKDKTKLIQYAIGKKEKIFALPLETKTILFRAFSDAYNLKYIDVCPVMHIEEKAFYYCSNLKTVLLDKKCRINGEKIFDFTAKDFSISYGLRGRTILFADIHGHLRLDFLSEKIGEIKLTENDVIIILGDAGIVWQIPMRDDIKNFYSGLPCNVLFLDGNHENFDLLRDLKKVFKYGSETHEVIPNVFHLIRGNSYLINGKKCFVFGGAYSLKRETNSSPIQTWTDELPSADDYSTGQQTINENENKFDFIFSHQAPRHFLDEISYEYASPEIELLDYLESINQNVKYNHWYCGHIHKDIKKENITSLYNDYEVFE